MIARRARLGPVLGVLMLALAFVPAAAVAARPQRIVSLNLCTDQLLPDLVPRERIVAVSFLGKDPTLSVAAARLTGIPAVHGAAEEVMALAPDLVLAGEYSTPATVGMLQRLGVPVVRVPLASDLQGVRAAIETLGVSVGEPERAAALAEGLDRALGQVAPRQGPRPTAIAYQVNGLVSGGGTLVDALLTAAGFANRAGAMTLGAGGRVALETLIADPPDLLVLAHGPDDFRTAVAENLRHPALAELMRSRPFLRLAMPHWLCGTPAVVEAVRELAGMRDRIASAGGRR